MSKILKTHPKSVQAHKDLILQCLEDKDESIRLRALDLLYGMVRNDLRNEQALALKRHLAGVQEELDGNREEADGAHGQSGGHRLPGRTVRKNHTNLLPEQLSIHHELRMVHYGAGRVGANGVWVQARW